MCARHTGIDPTSLTGLIADEVAEIVHHTGSVEAVQIVLSTGHAVVLTIWTDWTLMADLTPDSTIPDYFWPHYDHTRRPGGIAVPPGGLVIGRVKTKLDEFDEAVMGADITFGDQVLDVGQYGGNLVVSIR